MKVLLYVVDQKRETTTKKKIMANSSQSQSLEGNVSIVIRNGTTNVNVQREPKKNDQDSESIDAAIAFEGYDIANVLMLAKNDLTSE